MISAEEKNALEEAMSDVPSAKSTKAIPHLPKEVLIIVTKWLSSTDRKNCRLVCERWYDACSVYHKKEKFCFGSQFTYNSSDQNVDEITSTLSKSTRQCFHFELYRSFLESGPLTRFWETCGARIRSLKLIDCKLSVPTFANILKSCSVLQTLEFSYVDLGAIELNFIPLHLKNLSLKTLKIHSKPRELYRSSFWLHLVRKLFVSFPNISNFFCSQYDLDESEEYFNFKRSKGGYRGTQIKRAFEEYLTCDKMKNVAVNVLFDPTLLYDLERLTRITEIVIDWNDAVDTESFLKFAWKQSNLKKVTNICITEKKIENEDLDTFVPAVLKIPSLREFHIFFYRGFIQWNNKWSASLSASNVEGLCILGFNVSFARDSDDPYPLNSKLTSLVVGAKISCGSAIVSFLKTVPNLRDLCLSHVNDVILEAICANQVKLKSFTVGMVIGNSAWSLSNRLKQLRRLQIPERLMSKMKQVERLKVLRITDVEPAYTHLHYSEFNLDNLHQYSSPTLEVVWIDHVILTLPTLATKHRVEARANWFIDVVVQFVAELKNLKLLYFEFMDASHPDLTEVDVSKVFDQCPSLQMFVCENAFVRDVFTKRVQRRNVGKHELVQRYLNVNEERSRQFRAVIQRWNGILLHSGI